MAQKGFFIDVSRCVGCRTCTIACADLNNTPIGIYNRTVKAYEGGTWEPCTDGTWRPNVFAYYIPIACNECTEPACVAVCPVKAHYKRKEDGLVLVDLQKCIGCGACVQACPYGAPKLNPQIGKVVKCDACVARTSRGLAPVCVEACVERAIDFGDIDELRKKYGTTDSIAPLPDGSKTKPNLVIKAPKQAKPTGFSGGEVHRF